MVHRSSLMSKGEFVSLMALLMSLVALTIDTMLPAFKQIEKSLAVQNSNDIQLMVSMLFFGMALGFIFYGPLSDSYGRKSIINLGVSIFLCGSLISLLSTNFTIMLIGRVLQGFGVASCRVVSLAMIRDKFSGKEMAKTMSFIMLIFIIVPALAPSIGQLILFFVQWRAIFGLFLCLGIIGLLWLNLRQLETLPKEKRVKFSLITIIKGTLEALKHPLARGYMLASGLMFGAFIGYLSSAQQILQIQYNLGDLFPIYFGCIALSLGVSSFINSQLLAKFSMEVLCLTALIIISTLSFLFYIYAEIVSGQPSLSMLMAYLMLTFFCFGLLFANLNTLAMQPLGHIAGVASSVISTVQMLLSVTLGGMVGQLYNGTVLPLVLGFLIFSILALLIVVHTQHKHSRPLKVS